MSEQLKPCPFCGYDEPRLLSQAYVIKVYCPNCGASGPGYAFKTEKAIAGWNRRDVYEQRYIV